MTLNPRTALRGCAIALVASGVAVGVITAAPAHSSSAAAAQSSRVPPADESSVDAAGRLANAPNIVIDTPENFDSARLITDYASVVATANRIAQDVPVPLTGKVSDIDWAQLGSLTAAQIQGFIEFNASCDWYAYLQQVSASGDERSLGLAQRVIASVPNWPTMRLQERGVHAQAVAHDAAHNDVDAVGRFTLTNCAQ